jgi:hypothetical protein
VGSLPHKRRKELLRGKRERKENRKRREAELLSPMRARVVGFSEIKDESALSVSRK